MARTSSADPFIVTPDGCPAIRRDILAALLGWAETDATRASRCAVHFERDGARIVAAATDGHRLVALVVPTGIDVAIGTRPRDALERGVKVAKATGESYVPLPADGPRVDGFPDYRRVIPDRSPVAIPDGVGLNARYLAALADLAKATGQDGAILTAGDGPLGPSRWEAHSPEGWGFVGVIMPMRVHGHNDRESLPADLFGKEVDKAAQ